MSEVEKGIIEFKTSVFVTQVNKTMFDEYVNQFRGNYGEFKTWSFTNYYSKNGEYIGSSVRLHDGDEEYYLPKDRKS